RGAAHGVLALVERPWDLVAPDQGVADGDHPGVAAAHHLRELALLLGRQRSRGIGQAGPRSFEVLHRWFPPRGWSISTGRTRSMAFHDSGRARLRPRRARIRRTGMLELPGSWEAIQGRRWT